MQKLKPILVTVSILVLGRCASNKVDVDSVASLREIKETLDLAKEEGAEDLAPSSYQYAKEELENTAKVLHENPSTTEGDMWVNSARLAAMRALNITRESKTLSNKQPEQIALEREAELRELSEPLQLGDIRDKKFAEQTAIIQSAIKEKADLSTKTTELLGQKEKSDRQISRLQSLHTFNERLDAISNIFDESEADVFRKGNAVVVRLKTLQFPPGKAVITPDKFSLLNKLQVSIRTFKNPEVTIEGHTDATGSDSKNRELSLNRANTVKEYLTANKDVSPDKIKTLGSGSQHPIASNETAQGRLMNRRVDVIILPMSAE